ncbi:family A1 protease [Fomitiporia mediterranea MF3/22]|uniref:family A1 protease n=1 Tax=Fomitiporia mediterranea (strain MF3/22) TaxID=694068 RepID=UPI0004407E28|nr:family A1 protease [Fomitiporia mediterranea MF3/22]EJC99400.1 family A1 protease [Fomitiporia mediterranea MF3/22]
MFASSILLLAALVAAVPSPPLVRVRESKVTVPFVGRLNITGHTIAEIDRARAAQSRAKGKARIGQSEKRQSAFPIINEAVTYVATVGVGSPATSYDLLIDTGSSNTWVGAGKRFVETSTSQDTGDLVSVQYGSGFFIGEEFSDTVTLAEGLVIENQGIGDALISQGFDGVDGILGIGPTDLTEGTVDGIDSVPTVTDNLFSQGIIPEKVVGVFFAPTNSLEIANGELSFGQADASKITSDVVFTPITSTSPASEFFGIDQSITYGSDGTVVLPSTAGIVDTGTTLFLLPTDAFNTYTTLTGATMDNNVGLLSLTPENFANLQSLFFNIGGSAFEFTPNAQLWPRALNTAIGGPANGIFLIVSDLGTNSGEGFDFVNGFAFLERFYSIFDSTNNQVGFAATAHTMDETN